jgi:hypothetical protein
MDKTPEQLQKEIDEMKAQLTAKEQDLLLASKWRAPYGCRYYTIDFTKMTVVEHTDTGRLQDNQCHNNDNYYPSYESANNDLILIKTIICKIKPVFTPGQAFYKVFPGGSISEYTWSGISNDIVDRKLGITFVDRAQAYNHVGSSEYKALIS